MLRDYFTHAATWERHCRGPVGAHFESYCSFLEEKQYAARTVRKYLRASMHLGRWAATHELPLEGFNERTLEAFKRHLQSCRCREHYKNLRADRSPAVLQSARGFLRYLRAKGIAPPGPTSREPPRPVLLHEYSAWMIQHRGMQESTLRCYRHYLALLLRSVGSKAERLTVQALRAFILREAQRGGPQRTQNILKSTRSFVRYLIAQGRCPSGLDNAIPRVPNWRLRPLPEYLPATDVQRLLDACDISTPIGLRDRAMLLLGARLALRGQDIRLLRLADINWDDGTLRVSGKSQREARLPLPQEVGDAIQAYLTGGRPRVDSPFVFLGCLAPYRPLAKSGVANSVGRAVERSGVKAPSRGSHLLRYSAASEMLRQGATLQSISAVLRHQHLSTTTLYAKVDVEALRSVAQPWPSLPTGTPLPRRPKFRRVTPC